MPPIEAHSSRSLLPDCPLPVGYAAGSQAENGASGPNVSLIRPASGAERPLLLSSPHSGARYPAEFVAASKLDPVTLRRSEDAFVDEIFEAGPALGAGLVKALFPRAYCDPNREAFELDPGMFSDPLPPYVNRDSRRAALGLGTIARLVANGADIYRHRIPFSEALYRVAACWLPYHRTLAAELETLRDIHGFVILVDCHSMPSVGGPSDRDPGAVRPDIVLGDRFGHSCDPALTGLAEELLRNAGLKVARNMPFAGGFITEHYGRPAFAVHGLQIEINRALYMDEARMERRHGLQGLKAVMSGLIAELGQCRFPGQSATQLAAQ